jgi:hypothetical protein
MRHKSGQSKKLVTQNIGSCPDKTTFHYV